MVQWLEPKGCVPWNQTPGLWRDMWRPIKLSLVVNNSGVKYMGNRHAEHLIQTIKDHYQVSMDWQVKRYCGITMKWNYQKQVVDLSMPGYIQAALHNFQHIWPAQKLHAPHSWERPDYVLTKQFAKVDDTTRKLPPERILWLHQITGTLLFYYKEIDFIIPVALGPISASQPSVKIKT